MAKKRKSKKQGPPGKKGRKNEVFTPKRDSENRFPQMQKMTARNSNRPSGHSAKKK